jgi:hypothetical protein
MDVEVGQSIGKFIKLETLWACIYTTINIDNTGMTEEMVIVMAKRLPQLRTLSVNYLLYRNKLVQK